MNDFNPDWVSPPGDSISTLMELKQLSHVEVANQLDLTLHELQLLLSGKRRIDEMLAGKISVVIGSTPSFWIRRDEHFVKDCIRLNKEYYL